MLKQLKRLLGITIGLALILTSAFPVHAADGGAGMVWIRSPYKAHDDYYIPFPSLQLDTKYFFIKQLELGFYLYRDEMGDHELTLGITPGFTMFNPDKTDDAQLAFLDKRKMAADVYLKYLRCFKFGTIGAKIFMDALGNADGFGADVFYKLPIFINAFTIAPGAGLTFASTDRTRYYYGISHEEAKRSGLDYYDPDFSLTPYVFVEASLMTEEGWNIFANFSYSFFGNEITDSPMIEDNKGLILSIGAMINF